MGTLNLKKEPHHYQKVTDALSSRGLILDTRDDWEIHGPHDGMNYQVYVGYAVAKDDKQDRPLVAIYPRAVYEIGDDSTTAKAGGFSEARPLGAPSEPGPFSFS